ncbi:tetratricopeptide repeat protein [Spirillospora sp. CA-294931]|uniref:nSTAND1 domain-containing NTPase n=1 Tax=Spirillospora sp. CA-294931 TaxID=3240042 RepID=UPI003D9183AF
MTVKALEARALGPSPFIGDRPFTGGEADRFFGRSAETGEVAGLWHRHRLTILYGPSGAGRTSLLQAGVIPRLGSSRVDVLPVGRVSRESAFPTAALPAHNPFTLALLASWSAAEPVSRLAGSSLHDFLRRRRARTDELARPVPVLAVIDQAEELFRDDRRRDRGRLTGFIDELADTLDEHRCLRLLLSVRQSHLPDLLPFEERLGGGDSARFQLRALSPSAAGEALDGPLTASGRSFAAGAARRLVDDLRAATETVEPALLQAAARALWDALPAAAQVVGLDQVRIHPGAERALTAFVERTLARVAWEQGTSAARLRGWLETVVNGAAARRDTGIDDAVARALEDGHLLTCEREPDGPRYRLRHPRLAGPIRGSGDPPLPEVGASGSLRAAERAEARGDLVRAEHHASDAAHAGADTDLRVRAEAETVLGNVARERGDGPAAEARYRVAAELFEARGDTEAVGRLLAAIGRSRLARGDRAGAADDLTAAAARIPGDLTVRTALAESLWELGDAHGAIAVLSHVLATDGDTPEALIDRGEILASQGRAQDALRDLDRVRRRPPAARAARALALATLDRPGDAGEEIGTALAEAPGNGPALLYAALVAELRGEPGTAADLAGRAAAANDPPLPPHQLVTARGLLGGTGV